MSCSFPIFRNWFNARFKDLCDKHDAEWVKRDWRVKVVSDHEMCRALAERGHIALSYGAALWFVIGIPFWLWKKYKDSLKQFWAEMRGGV